MPKTRVLLCVAVMLFAACGCQPTNKGTQAIDPGEPVSIDSAVEPEMVSTEPDPAPDPEDPHATLENQPELASENANLGENTVAVKNANTNDDIAPETKTLSSSEPQTDEETKQISTASQPNNASKTTDINSELASRANEPTASPSAYRLLLPTTSGPLLVGVDILIDEKPLAIAFSQRIESALKTAADGGDLTWSQLLQHVSDNPRIFGTASRLNENQYRGMIQRYDKNRNKKPEYEEATRLLFRDSRVNGEFRLVGTDSYRQINRTNSAAFSALDINDNGVLEPNEIDSAISSLKKLDGNADQRIDRNEIESSNVDESLAWNSRRSTRWGDVAMDLSGYVDWSMLAYTLGEMPGKDPFASQPNAISRLRDGSADSLNSQGAKKLLEVTPDFSLIVRYSSQGEPPKISIASMPQSLQETTTQIETLDQVRIHSPDFCLIAGVTENRAAIDTIPPAAFAMLDANNDGALEESEIPEPAREQYSIADFDQDGDAKLTLKEINEGMLPESSIWDVQVRGRAAEVPDGTFTWLDENHDGFLSTREIGRSSIRLHSLISKEKSLRATNIPDMFFVQFVRGQPDRDATLFAQVKTLNQISETSQPRWFRSMDSNRDGDVSHDEFPGQAAEFEKLDHNQDGFIDSREAQSDFSAQQ